MGYSVYIRKYRKKVLSITAFALPDRRSEGSMTPLRLPAPSDQRTRVMTVEELRRQALTRLQKRLRMVDELIRSLENYQRAQVNLRGNCTPISQSRKCS